MEHDIWSFDGCTLPEDNYDPIMCSKDTSLKTSAWCATVLVPSRLRMCIEIPEGDCDCDGNRGQTLVLRGNLRGRLGR